MTKLSFVPPTPELMVRLFARYKELVNKKRLHSNCSFEQFYSFWRSRRRGETIPGLDDGHSQPDTLPADLHFIDPPSKKLKGTIRTIVLLVDFEDQPASDNRTPALYEQMLFGRPGEFLTGSMREYYQHISNFDPQTGQGIDIVGEVYGWLRMPEKLSFYTNNASGTANTFPRNAQGLTRDAVLAAIDNGINFDGYDNLGEGHITALFIIHAGRGAEQTGSTDDIWSHKWVIPNPIKVNDNPLITASTYLTVPEDCNMGVCAHEWGHLAARWADYYDTGRFNKSNGLGQYCLMASGSWGQGGLRPTLPNGMLRMFHDWIEIREINSNANGLELKPAAEGGGLILIRNPKTMKSNQYVVVEYRRRKGWDAALPDEGLAIYIVDENIPNVNNEDHLAIELLQADGKRHLAKVFAGNTGDSNDLYPSLGKRTIGKTTIPSLTLPSGEWTGIKIRALGNPGDETMKINVEIVPV